MLSPLPKLPSNLDLVEARLLQHGPNGPEIDRPDPSLPAEPKKPATAEDTKLDPETIGFDPSFGEYDSDGHSSLDKYLSGSLFGNFMKWITSELWPQLEKYLGKGYDKLILQNLPPDRVNAHRDGQSSEKAPAAPMTPAEQANVEGLSYDQQVFLGTNLPNENGQQLSADNTLLLKEFASFREGLEAKTPEEIGLMHDQITKHLESLVAFVDKPEEEQASLAYVQSKAEFFKDLKTEIDNQKIADQDVLNQKFMDFNNGNAVPTMFTDQGKTLQTIIDAKNSDATASLGNKSALLLANYWLEQDFLLLKTLVPEAKKSEEPTVSPGGEKEKKEKTQGEREYDLGVESAMIVGLQTGELEIPSSRQKWDQLGSEKLLRRSQDLFPYRHELHRHIIDNDKGINSSYLFTNKLITGADYEKLGKINSDVTELVNAISDEGFGVPEASSPLLKKYRNEIATKLSSGGPMADKRVQAYYEQVLNYLDYAQAYVDRQPRVLFDKIDLTHMAVGDSKVININSTESPFLYIDHLGSSKMGKLNIKQNSFELTLDGKKYNVNVGKYDSGIGPINLIVEKDKNGLVSYYLDFPDNNGDDISENAFYLNEFIRINGDVSKVANGYKANFDKYIIIPEEKGAKKSDVPAETQLKTSVAPTLTQAESDELIDFLDGENFDLQFGLVNHDIEIRNVKNIDGKLTFDFFVDDDLEFGSDRKLATGTIEKQNDGSNYSLILGTLDGDISKKLDISKSKEQLIQPMSLMLNDMLVRSFAGEKSWFKAENFDNNAVIIGGEDDNFSRLTLGSSKKSWTVELKDGRQIQVDIQQNIDRKGDITEMLLVANKNNKPVVGPVPWPDDVYGVVDRTGVFKQAANRLVNAYLDSSQ